MYKFQNYYFEKPTEVVYNASHFKNNLRIPRILKFEIHHSKSRLIGTFLECHFKKCHFRGHNSPYLFAAKESQNDFYS